MDENRNNKQNSVCRCSKESVAFELFKEIRFTLSSQDWEKIHRLDSKKRVTYFLDLYHACLRATQGSSIASSSIPDIT